MQVVLTAIVVTGLGVDAFVHFHLAYAFPHTKTSTLSEADLFHLDAIAAVIAAAALLVRPRRYAAAFAFLVCCGWDGSRSGVSIRRRWSVRSDPEPVRPLLGPAREDAKRGSGRRGRARRAGIAGDVPPPNAKCCSTRPQGRTPASQ